MASPFGDHPIRILCRCLRSPQRLLGGATEKESPELAEALQDVSSNRGSGEKTDPLLVPVVPTTVPISVPTTTMDFLTIIRAIAMAEARSTVAGAITMMPPKRSKPVALVPIIAPARAKPVATAMH